jgi:transcriptional regulator with GAF, ATPase, and Fis domain
LNSTNGTFLEGVRLFEAEVPLNRVLRVGETELVFEPVSAGRPEPSFHGIVGRAPAVRHLVEFIQRVAPSQAVVTILGESGTGKELRVLESGEVKPVGSNRPFRMDVRVVTATHRNLRVHARQGKFREDLYYRLGVMPVVLPPLRSRRGDLRLLAEHSGAAGGANRRQRHHLR